MKLRLELLLVPVAVGASWLFLATRGGRAERDAARVPEERPDARSERAVELAEPRRPDVLAAGSVHAEDAVARPARGVVVPAPRASTGVSRGRLVDAETHEPIPDALVVTANRNDQTDAGGWFDTGEPLDGLAEVMVLNVGSNTDTPEVPRERWTRLADAWQVPLAIGPTFRLRFSGVEPPPGAAWEARVTAEGRTNPSWLSVRAGPPPYVRYDRPFDERARALPSWLEARTRDGLVEGRAELSALAGVQEVEIECSLRPVLRGRVLDERGAPLGKVVIDAIQLAGSSPEQLLTTTGDDGNYVLGPREPGRLLLAFLPPASTTTRKLNVDVPRGITRAPDMVLERRAPAGDVRGLLWVRSKDIQVDGVLRLRALDGSGFERTKTFSVGGRRAIASTLVNGALVDTSYEEATPAEEFLFERVPPGRFELTASASHGYACLPAALEVSAPAENLVLRFDNSVGLRSYFLELTEAESGSAVRRVLADVRIDGGGAVSGQRWENGEALIELAEGIGFRWTVGSGGYRLERGSERDFVLRDGSLVATRRLRRGFGARLELRERSQGADHRAMSLIGSPATRRPSEMESTGWRWIGSPVAGAEILADGVPVATSDERGIADLDLAAQPGRIEVRLPGWRVLDSWGFRNGSVQTFPVAEVWLIRE